METDKFSKLFSLPSSATDVEVQSAIEGLNAQEIHDQIEVVRRAHEAEIHDLEESVDATMQAASADHHFGSLSPGMGEFYDNDVRAASIGRGKSNRDAEERIAKLERALQLL